MAVRRSNRWKNWGRQTVYGWNAVKWMRELSA